VEGAMSLWQEEEHYQGQGAESIIFNRKVRQKGLGNIHYILLLALKGGKKEKQDGPE
jgi:hypothetical protein